LQRNFSLRDEKRSGSFPPKTSPRGKRGLIFPKNRQGAGTPPDRQEHNNQAHNHNTHAMGKIKGAVVIDTERCKGCSLCIVACPTKTLALATGEVNHRGYPFCIETADTCIGCASCGIVCPDGCISVYRKKEE